MSAQDLWDSLLGSAPPPAGPPAKVRAVESDGKNADRDKLAVINAAKIRMLIAATMTVIHVPTSTKYWLNIQKIRSHYTTLTKGKQNHGLGGPDTFTFSALVLTTLETATDTKVRDMLSAYHRTCPPGSLPAKRAVRSCQTEKMFSPDMKRVMIKVAPECEELLSVLRDSMINAGCIEQHHTAPAGYLERQLVDPSAASSDAA